jgi:type IV pilus assembly protein PilP
VADSSSNVHPVKIGNYMGRNHGKIIEVSSTQIQLEEIVSDGMDGYFLRPKVITLTESG